MAISNECPFKDHWLLVVTGTYQHGDIPHTRIDLEKENLYFILGFTINGLYSQAKQLGYEAPRSLVHSLYYPSTTNLNGVFPNDLSEMTNIETKD